jgi:hypothetical protein
MPIYSKPISALSTDDLNELINEAAVENVRLEFKREEPSKDEIIKKLSSFANTYGGWLIIGANADSSDGRLTELPGVEKVPGYKQRIIQWCYNSISPPIELAVSDPIPTPTDPRRFCYVIYIPESDLAPHFINGRKGIYVRTDEYSQKFEPRLATLEEILHLSGRRRFVLDRRQAIIDRAKRRFKSYVETSYGELGKNPKGIGAHLGLIITPRYPLKRLVEGQKMLEIIGNERFSWRQVGFPRTTQGTISQQDSVLVLRPGSSFSLLEASVWGLLAYFTEIEIEIKTGVATGIHLDHFLGQLLAFAEHAGRILSKVGYFGSLNVHLDLQNIRGVPWIYFDHGFPETGPKSILDDFSSIVLEVAATRLMEQRDAFVIDLLKEIFFALNWPAISSSEDELRNIVLSGYKFNDWK